MYCSAAIPASDASPRRRPPAGTLAALSGCCLPPRGALHIYGFNWGAQLGEDGQPIFYRAGHYMLVERALVQMLGAALGERLVVHPTPCQDYHAC